MTHVILFPMWNVLYFNISTFRSRCACAKCGCFLFDFVLSRYVAQVIIIIVATTVAAIATTSSLKRVGSLVPDSLPSFSGTAVLPLAAVEMLVWNSRIVHYVWVLQPPGLLFLYFGVCLLRRVPTVLFVYPHHATFD